MRVLLGFVALLLACDRGASPPPAQPPADSVAAATPTPAEPPTSPAPTGPFDAMIVDWPAVDLSELERMISEGRPIFVDASGDATRLAAGCDGPAVAYSFRAAAPRTASADHRGRALESTIVGAWQTAPPTARGQLSGECDRVTHVARQIVTGAFSISGATSTATSTDVALPGGGVAGGSFSSTTSTSSKGGDLAACAAATATSPRPPPGCNAGIRLALVPLAR
jgi:hypothetical protein